MIMWQENNTLWLILLSDYSEVCPHLLGSWFWNLKSKQLMGPPLCFLSSLLSVCL